MISNELPPVLTIEEVMHALRCSRRTVSRLIADKKLVAIKIGRMVRITRESVELLINGKRSSRAALYSSDGGKREALAS
jgi:excisionase family DNA binding protein